MPRITICICVLLTLFCCLALGSSYLNAQPAADLRGKQGVVDPGDLKKHDPKPPAVRAKEPPPPAPKKSSPKGDTARCQYRYASILLSFPHPFRHVLRSGERQRRRPRRALLSWGS